MALAFTTGCNRRTAERRDCVDESGRITSEQNCQMAEERRRSGYIGPMIYYHYLYGGSTGGHIGDAVINGNPMPGMSAGSGTSGSTSRGGFGSTGSAGSGGSGGE